MKTISCKLKIWLLILMAFLGMKQLADRLDNTQLADQATSERPTGNIWRA